jgi:hypothetical protein
MRRGHYAFYPCSYRTVGRIIWQWYFQQFVVWKRYCQRIFWNWHQQRRGIGLWIKHRHRQRWNFEHWLCWWHL